jgi:hypothetical protein
LHGGGNAKAVVRAPQSRDLRIDRGQPVMRAPHVQLRLVRRAQVFLRNCGEPKLLFLTSRPRTWIRFPESRIDAKLSFSGFIVVSYLSRVFGELSIVERPRTSVALGVVSIIRRHRFSASSPNMCGRYVSPDEASIEREFTLVRAEWQFPPSYNVVGCG